MNAAIYSTLRVLVTVPELINVLGVGHAARMGRHHLAGIDAVNVTIMMTGVVQMEVAQPTVLGLNTWARIVHCLLVFDPARGKLSLREMPC